MEIYLKKGNRRDVMQIMQYKKLKYNSLYGTGKCFEKRADFDKLQVSVDEFWQKCAF